MRQVFLKKGKPIIAKVPIPQLQKGMILVEVRSSCLSPGTEMASMASSGKSLLQKAKKHPDKVRMALERMKTEGITSVIQQVRCKHEKELVVGYSAAGVVLDVAPDVKDFKKGMRVAIFGTGYASHAEYAAVPVNLATVVPDAVNFQEASTCAMGGIALQGVRRARVELGELVTVIGCGPLGLLTVQLLKAAGCRVIATDLNESRLSLASELGADFIIHAGEEGLVERVTHFCGGYGADKVIITASTQSNVILSQAFGMCRKKGRVVLVGVVGPEFNRADMYSKELDFVISTSYGPGRYDERYERFGLDYPYAYVRWTEKRNIEAYLKFIAAGSVKLDSILTGSFNLQNVAAAYESLGKEKTILVTFDFETGETKEPVEGISPSAVTSSGEWKIPVDGILRVGIVGAGSFIQSMHIPNLNALNRYYRITAICNQTGPSARNVARQLDSCAALTDYDDLLRSDIDLVLIGTRHNLHADLAIRALEAGKAVFVEKPMCITWKEYEQLRDVIQRTDAPFMVGYNRRFSPFAQEVRRIITNRINPVIIQYTMNAGYVSYDAWVHTQEGGGRIVGEACHIIDLFRYLVGYPPQTLSVTSITPKTDSMRSDDNTIITIKYEDGSVCTLIFTSIGSKKGEKESMKVFCDEQLLEMHDYKMLTGYGVKSSLSLKKQDKGHLHELEVFVKSVQEGKRFPISWEEMEETWKISRQAADAIQV
jgi:predicted dehydrogenase/threonine dehydrogenase-like Zn-dependent dehydrogenase